MSRAQYSEKISLPQLGQGICFEYSGRMDSQKVDMFLKWAESMVETRHWSVSRQKRFLRCLIEISQNLVKHAGAGQFLCHVSEQDEATLQTKNQVSGEIERHLKSVLEQAHEPAFEDLRGERLEKLAFGERTSQGGAGPILCSGIFRSRGLGLLDLRACSNDSVRAEFIPCDNGQSTFVLTVSIHN